MNRQKRRKIYLVVSFVFVLVLLAGVGTLAWMSLSTNPEFTNGQFSLRADYFVQIATADDPDNFQSSVDLSGLFTDETVELRPVSTVNGEDWFVAWYSDEGDVKDVNAASQKYSYLHFPDGGVSGNGSGTKAATTRTGIAVSNSTAPGIKTTKFYAYTDIYMKNDGSDCDVYLSIPAVSGASVSTDENKGYSYEADDDHYGTYVKSYTVSGDGKMILTEGGPETSVRIGFRTLGAVSGSDYSAYDEDISGEHLYKASGVSENDLIIYEPNADSRSLGERTSYTGNYVVGFDLGEYVKPDKSAEADPTVTDNSPTVTDNSPTVTDNSPTVTDNSPTVTDNSPTVTDNSPTVTDNSPTVTDNSPTVTDNSPAVTDNSPADEEVEIDLTDAYNALSGNYIPTYPIALNSKGTDGEESMVSPNKLIIQKKGTWKDSGKITSVTPNSADVEMGRFLSASTLYRGKSFSASDWKKSYKAVSTDNMQGSVSSQLDDGTNGVKITSLEDGNPVKIRIYFWLEGQDIDCWNDIRDVNFLVNLEFVSVEKSHS